MFSQNYRSTTKVFEKYFKQMICLNLVHSCVLKRRGSVPIFFRFFYKLEHDICLCAQTFTNLVQIQRKILARLLIHQIKSKLSVTLTTKGIFGKPLSLLRQRQILFTFVMFHLKISGFVVCYHT